MRVVICGGGVIGATIAYFLSLRGIEALVIERCGVACAASGKSGGFLALDWCDGSPLAPLARRSFALHAELAETLGVDWGYRRLDTLSVVSSARRDLGRFARSAAAEWLDGSAEVTAQLGTPDTTAQVDPAAFTKAMMAAAVARGARLRIGSVTGLTRTADGAAITGAVVDGEAVPADAVIVAMGPWSAHAGRWLPLPAVFGLKGHSLVFRYAPPSGPHALFVELETASGAVLTPEIYPRPDGTTYVCGLPGEPDLPPDPERVVPDIGAPEQLREIIGRVAPDLADADLLATQACHRPIVQDGLPIIGPIQGLAGAYVATAHSVWGILNAPATGEAMAELIADGASAAVDLSPFDPGRLPHHDRSGGAPTP